MTELRECTHDWETGNWGVIIGVSKCKKCGKISMESDFICGQTEDEWRNEMMGEIQRHGGGG